MTDACRESVLSVAALVALIFGMGGIYVGSWLAQLAARGKR